MADEIEGVRSAAWHEGPVIVPCECLDPRCTNRVAVLLVGDDDPAAVSDGR